MGKETMTSIGLAWAADPWDFGTDHARFSRARPARFRISSPQVSAPTTSSEPTWFEPTLARFVQVAELQDDWDRRGSAEVRVDVLSFALRSVLPEILPPNAPAPAVIPLGHGGVQLVWNSDEAEIEVEVIAPNEVVAYYFNKTTGDEREETLTNDFASLAEVMWSTFKN
jgi:hypothetical protein